MKMKTTALLLLLPFLALCQTPPAPAPAPPKAAPKAAPKVAPRAAQPQPRYTPVGPGAVQQQQPQPRYTAPAAPRTVQQPQPRYTPPAAQPRYTAPRAVPAVNVMPRTRNGATLSRDIVLANPHGLFSHTVHPRAYAPGFVLRVNSAPPPFRASAYVASPGVGYVWIPGYWFWADGQYMWIEGVWMTPPIAGAHWVSPAWSLQDDATWALEEGYWMDPNGESQDPQQQTEQPPVQQIEQPPLQQVAEPVEQSAPVPDSQAVAIVNGGLVVNPFQNVWYRFTVGTDAETHTVAGDFSTQAPAGVEIRIDDGKQKGRKTTVFYRTPVLQTSGTFDVPLSPGVYYLYVSNPSDQTAYVNVNAGIKF